MNILINNIKGILFMFSYNFKLSIVLLSLLSINAYSSLDNDGKNNNKNTNQTKISLAELGLNEYQMYRLREELKRNPTTEELIERAELLGTYSKNSWISPQTKVMLQNATQVATSLFLLFTYAYIQVKLTAEDDSFNVYQPGEIKENFNSIAGNQEAKDAFEDIVAYLKNPEIYKAIGARPTKGILLTGAPGTGKTLIARALAGEVNCSFIYASGSEFNNIYVGTGANRIRKLFNQARNQTNGIFSSKKTPCIIFIDEFECLAHCRGSCMYTDQTVNELLTQLDGFTQESVPVILIAATNFPQKIDPAIVRPGRIDRTIHIDNPDYLDRKGILQIHLNKVKHNLNINLSSIAQRTIGFTGAELAQIIQSAARIAANRKSVQVEQEDIENALDIITLGVASKKPLSETERKITAYHEAGHALINMILNKKFIVNKITILPRGQALGVTYTMPKEELDRLTTKEEFLNQICMLFGGRAAEEIIFNIVSTGPSSDLASLTNIAHDMVKHYGMGKGLAVETCSNELSNDAIQKIIETILEEQYQRTKKLLEDNIDKLHKLTNALLEKETLYAPDIKELEFGFN